MSPLLSGKTINLSAIVEVKDAVQSTGYLYLRTMIYTLDFEDRKEPYWHYLIRHFVQRGYVSNGLTIPFLIGAKTVISRDSAAPSIETFTQWIARYGATVMHCGNVQEFIVGSIDYELRPNATQYQRFDKLLVSDRSLANKKNIKEVIRHFEQLYDLHVNAGDYSKNDGEWTPFTAVELQRIKEIA